MKILYYDCFAGISGDMHLGAMLDLGIDADYLKQELSKLNVDHEFELVITRKDKMGITGFKVDVKYGNERLHDHTHDHDHTS
jgi:pyridinium-3,5-bisthiocarboxylic acid mononucleotide nickel chelatase